MNDVVGASGGAIGPSAPLFPGRGDLAPGRRDLLPSPLEVATGFLFGLIEEPGDAGPDGETPRAALEAAVRPALERGPCAIGFSGGRDSSALLAIAARLAEREGWDPPLPVSLRFDDPDTRESEWQQRVVTHLRLSDWLRPELTDELDFVGELAAAGLQRHGVLYPPNVHLVAALAEHVPGGSVLTGAGGDEVFGGWAWYDVGHLIAGRRPFTAADVRRLAHLLAPLWIRHEVGRRQNTLSLPWLLPAVRAEITHRVKDELSGAPRTWSARMAWLARWRGWRATAWSAARLGFDRGMMVGSPLIEPRFLAALARAGGRAGWGDRTATMRALFGDLLPVELITRRTKATFSRPFFGPHTQAFAQSWDGVTGIDSAAVDAGALRHTWADRYPHFFSAMSLQAAWLATQRHD